MIGELKTGNYTRITSGNTGLTTASLPQDQAEAFVAIKLYRLQNLRQAYAEANFPEHQ
jgi:hypothetical protein